MTLRGIDLAALRRRARQMPQFGLTAIGLVLSLLVLGACSSTNTYPIDFFSEMHYQKSWHSQEPPRHDSPPNAVPFGADVTPNYSREEAAEKLENPLPRDEQVVMAGKQVYAVNCQTCHGENGDGQGMVGKAYFATTEGVPAPADYHSPEIVNMSDGELFWVVTNGSGEYMPAFGHLMTEEQRWQVVHYIRELQGQ